MAPNASSSASTATVTVPLVQQLPHLQIVDRLVDQFPLVNTGLDYALSRYEALKSSSQIVGGALGRAEKSLEYVVSSTVVPVLNQLEQPIHYADNKAVQGFDLAKPKLDSLIKSSGEIADSTRKVIDQTASRISAAKSSAVTTVQSKVHSVLALPSNVVPLVDQILSAGEHVLDYLLPGDGKEDKSAANGSAAKLDEDPADTRALIRLVIVRMRRFSDKVQKRVVDYSRDRWIPLFFSKVVLVKGNLSQLIPNGTKKLQLANGHAAEEPKEETGATNSSPNKQSPTKKQTSTSNSPKSTTTNTSTNQSSPSNGDVPKQTDAQSSS